MITPSPARLQQCDIPALHASIASAGVLRRERRALYQLAVELLTPGPPQVLAPDLLDSPLARHHIGEALAGRADFARSRLLGVSAVSEMPAVSEVPGTDPPGGSAELRVVSRPEANALLAGALHGVGAELDRQQAASGAPELLTAADSERFPASLSLLRQGQALARSVSPVLVEDLLTHVALVGVVDARRAGRLGSASPRGYPGLILLASPRSEIEVAEALVHEGAHQKLFELAITHDLVSDVSDRCAAFHPPWGSPARRWPLEQALAACHAYACLARFGDDLGMPVASGRADTRKVDADSLLPVANERSEIIGNWLLDKGDYLGPDARTLLRGLFGQRMCPTDSPPGSSRALAASYIIEPGLELRRCGSPNRVLVGRRSRPPQLYWISDDASVLLEALGRKPLGEVLDTFAQRWQVSRFDASSRFSALLTDLCASGLVTQKRHSGAKQVTRS